MKITINAVAGENKILKFLEIIKNYYLKLIRGVL